MYSGRALSFGGVSDEVDCGSNTLIRGGTECTFSFWMNSDDNTDGRAVITQWNSGGELNWGLWAMGSGKIQFHDGVSANLSDSNLYNNDGNWYHVSVTKNGTAVKFYVNGILHSSATSSGSTIDNNGVENTFIGSKQTGDYFDGEIGNLKVFNSELTIDQIRELYTKPETVLPTGVSASNLKLDLPMQEGSGSYIYDGSGNQNHGTISGATWVTGEEYGYQASLVRSNTPMIFDGVNDYVDAGGYNFGTNDWTISFWARPNNNASMGDILLLFMTILEVLIDLV